MTQNRPPPAFQEYASSMMARTHYRLMSLSGRGLLYSMRLECWVNHGLPENPNELAKVLGFDAAEVRNSLPCVMPFFAVQNGLIVCPELDDYRNHLSGIRGKQADGGKKGAAKTNGKRKLAEPIAEQGAEGVSSNPRVTRDSTRDSLVKYSSVKSSTTQPLKESSSEECEAWKEWNKVPATSNDYDKASNGF